MQAEILAANPTSRIRIVALNGVGKESGFALAVEGRTLPVVQETPEVDVRTAWGRGMDDLVVLDGEGLALGLTNLRVHDLSIAPEYDALLDYLRLAAGE